ncbi:uncharacterized protein LOC115631750 [Scaptodrosophila lebanonensis]|uniref:Uncharacterized protein LOC115631750 n=1 Tax=Drosophila lebanonensis TaxID=7225 RepID=A0A6J2UB84_DROLE|nr:uncharacterized protein LOC115631750 [Scaptodrosophila lebanonensis]
MFSVLTRSPQFSAFALSNFVRMAGHSKWQNIKHIKAQKDGVRAALFTKLSRQIRLAIQEEGSSVDPNLNSQLSAVIDTALKKNMPMDTIQNVIKKSQQSKLKLKKHRLDIRYKKHVYMVCIIYTDNFPGVKMDATAMVKKSGGVFVDVSHMFDSVGLVEARLSSKLHTHNLEDVVMEDAIEFGAEDVSIVDSESLAVNFFCNPIQLKVLTDALEKKGYIIDTSEHVFTPHTVINLSTEEQKLYNNFVAKLRDVPGLEDIYDNVENTD